MEPVKSPPAACPGEGAGCGVWGTGSRVRGSVECRARGAGCGLRGAGCGAWSSGCAARDTGFGVRDTRFRVWGAGCGECRTRCVGFRTRVAGCGLLCWSRCVVGCPTSGTIMTLVSRPWNEHVGAASWKRDLGWPAGRPLTHPVGAAPLVTARGEGRSAARLPRSASVFHEAESHSEVFTD